MANICRLGQVWCAPNFVKLQLCHDSTVSGDISHIEIMGKHIVVLNSFDVAMEMLHKKSSKYSDRPILPMCGELVGCKYTLPLLPYGDLFRETRRKFHRFIGTHAVVKECHENGQLEVHRFLKRVLEHPEQLALHIRRYGHRQLLDLD